MEFMDIIVITTGKEECGEIYGGICGCERKCGEFAMSDVEENIFEGSYHGDTERAKRNLGEIDIKGQTNEEEAQKSEERGCGERRRGG